MTKAEFITKLAEEQGKTKKAAGEDLTAFVKVITDVLVEGDSVKIPGLGTFSAVDVAERTGIIQMGDRKGETYVTPAHKAPKFKASKTLKDIVK